MRATRLRPRNADRRADRYARNFGEEAERVRHMPCLACGGFAEPCHVTARGMGGVKGGRFDIVPLCREHHIEAGEAGTSQRATFEREHGLDLRAEADRIAVGHEAPLGMRGVAARWVAAALDDYDWESLLAWVRRRMAAEVTERKALREEFADSWCWTAAAVDAHKYDGLPDDDREALTGAVGHDLDICSPHGDRGSAAWALCDVAGWP